MMVDQYIDHRMCPNGLFSVTRHDRGFKQIWVYTYPSNNHVRRISSPRLKNLRKMVEKKGLPWIVTDMDKAMQAYKADEARIEEFPRLHRHPHDPISGVKHVSYTTNDYGQIRWIYTMFEDGERVRSFSDLSLIKLREKVEELGLDWIIVNQKSYEDHIRRERENNEE